MKQIIPRVQTTYLEHPTCTNSVTIVINDWKYPLYPLKNQEIGVAHAMLTLSRYDMPEWPDAYNKCISPIAPILQASHTKQYFPLL